MRLLYESLTSMYFPTTATRVSARGDFTRLTTASQRDRSVGRGVRPRSFETMSSSPSL